MENENPTITHRVITKDRVPVGNFHHRTYETTVKVDDCGGGDFLEQKLTMQSDVTMKVYEEFPDVHIVELNYRLELPISETKYTVTYSGKSA